MHTESNLEHSPKCKNFRFSLFAIVMISFLLLSCSKDRIMDRFDERVMSSEEDQYNLYSRDTKTKTISTLEDYITIPAPNSQEAYFRYKNLSDIEPVPFVSPDFADNYALVSVCWKKTPPVLRFWTRFLNIAKWVELSIPLSDANSFILPSKEDEDINNESYCVIASIRQKTYMPWVVQDDYEIFKVKITGKINDKGERSWGVEEITQITDNRQDDIQAILSPDRKSIIYVLLDGNDKTLMKMDIDGGNPQILVKDASLPYFIPDSGRLMFVKNSHTLRDFKIYDFELKKEVPATDEELETAIETLPYATLKSKYMLIDNFRKRPDKSLESNGEKIYTLKELIFQGLKTSPAILKDYFKYEASISSTSASLYDEGPDWFSSGAVIPKEHMLTDEGDVPIGDRIATENFLRLITGLSVPIIPNLPLRFARYESNKCQEEVYRQHLHKTINDFIENMISAYFDAVEAELLLPIYREKVKVNRQRLERNRRSAQLGGILKVRELFAENMLAASESDYNAAVERLIHSKFAISALLGEKNSRNFSVVPPALSWDMPPIRTSALSFFQAQSQINHPDIQRINAMIIKAASVRDMGPPARRVDAVKVNVSYGLGFDNWSKLVDDFLQVGITAMIPLRLPILDNAYYDKWSAEIYSIRQEKYKIQAELKRDVHEAYMDLNILQHSLNAMEKRFAFQKENFRLSRIYEKLGRLEVQNEDADKWLLNYPLITKISMLDTKARLIASKCDFFRRTARLYAASGISSRLIPEICKASEPESNGKEYNRPNNRSIFLWESEKVVTNKTQREEFLKLCSDTNIKRVYFFLSRTTKKELYLDKYDLEISYFINECANKGIEVYALMGNVEWVEGYYHDEIQTLLTSLNNFDRAQKNDDAASFAGIKLDVEPHALPEWHTDKRKHLVSAYLDTLDFVRKHYSGTISVDIPYTYNSIPVPGSKLDLIANISERVDFISIMAYLNSVAAIRKRINPIFSRSDITVPLEIALETAPVKEKGISFFATPYTTFENACVTLKKDFSENTSFAGFAFHDYKYFRQMLLKAQIKE